jgi:hypothetical protein
VVSDTSRSRTGTVDWFYNWSNTSRSHRNSTDRSGQPTSRLTLHYDAQESPALAGDSWSPGGLHVGVLTQPLTKSTPGVVPSRESFVP